MAEEHAQIVNVDELEPTERLMGAHWGARYKQLTPSMRARGGKLGVGWMCVPKGRSVCPFHAHQREDEVFFILSGKGLFRYGDTTREVRAGDCISCPAGTGTAHQLANPHEEDLIYLAIGNHDPDEVCTYPDSGKVMVRSLGRIGNLEDAGYLDGEPAELAIFKDA